MSLPKQANVSDSEAGFTLVEMLVTVALVALLATLMIGAIVQMRSMSAISQRNDIGTEFDALGNYLEKIVANAKPLILVKDNPDRLVFEGTSTRMRFVSIVRIASDQLALREVELEARQKGDLVDLIQASSLRRLSNAAEATPVGEVSAPELITDLKFVRFEYLVAERPTVAAQSIWQETWKEPEKLPHAVRIIISAERSGQLVKLERTINLALAE